MQKASFAARLASVLIGFLVIYFIDVYTSSDLSLFPLYLIPIGLALFNFGSLAAYLACLGSGLLWLIADIQTNSQSRGVLISLQWMLARLLVYLLLAHMVVLYDRAVARARDRIDRISRLLPVCPHCGQIFCHDGQWRPLDDLIASPSQIGQLPEHGCFNVTENPSRHPDR